MNTLTHQDVADATLMNELYPLMSLNDQIFALWARELTNTPASTPINRNAMQTLIYIY